MKTIKNKTQIKPSHSNNNFFILSKGYNAGKPVAEPTPNCFIVEGKTPHETATLFWICYILWKSGSYFPLLGDTIIPSVRLRDLATEIQVMIERVHKSPNDFYATVSRLQELIRTEKLLNLQMKLVAEIKINICLSRATEVTKVPARKQTVSNLNGFK